MYTTKRQLLNDKIKSLESELEKVKLRNTELIGNIIEKVYPNSVFYPENNGKPENDKQIMEAAFLYLFEIKKQWSTDISISKAYWSESPLHKLPLYNVSQRLFSDDYDKSVKVTYLKHLHHAINIQKLWVWAVQQGYTNMSLAQFTKKYQGKNLYAFIKKNSYQNPYNSENLFLITEKKLHIKDVVIVTI